MRSWDQLKLYQLSLGSLEMQLMTLTVAFCHRELVSCKTAAPVRRRMSYSTVSVCSVLGQSPSECFSFLETVAVGITA